MFAARAVKIGRLPSAVVGVNRPDAVRIWHLLAHTSGMEEELHKSLFLAGKADPRLLDTATGSGCRFFAGTRKPCCSLAFAGLEEIVRVVAGQDLEAYLQEHLFAPPAGIYGHDGWAGCMFWMYPREGVCFSFMTNLLDAGVHGVDPAAIHKGFASCLG